MKIKDLLIWGEKQLESITNNPRKEIKWIIMEVADLRLVDFLINEDLILDIEKVSVIKKMVLDRKNKKPLQYILGKQEFMGLKFYVDSNVLIPRSDTEILVETVIDLFENNKKEINILELGVGSGAISVSLAKYLSNSKIIGIDISEKAIEVARKNAINNDIKDKINFLTGDLFNPLKNDCKFDIIVSNPPYIPKKIIQKLDEQVKNYEPLLALDGGEDGLDFYRKITDKSVNYLKNNGILAYEIGYDQGQDLINIMNKDFKDIKLIKDLPGHDRVVIGVLK